MNEEKQETHLTRYGFGLEVVVDVNFKTKVNELGETVPEEVLSVDFGEFDLNELAEELKVKLNEDIANGDIVLNVEGDLK